MLQRLKQRRDFERALMTPAVARSPHFAVHAAHTTPEAARGKAFAPELSTSAMASVPKLVDDLSAATPAVAAASAGEYHVGAVIPKRHARRAVTRSLVKRQVWAAFERGLPLLSPGIWVVRLRAPFDLQQYPSAAPPALKRALRLELDPLLERAARARQAAPARAV